MLHRHLDSFDLNKQKQNDCQCTFMKQSPISENFIKSASFLGDLDPDRMGSGIQYGDPSKRRTLQPRNADGGKCPC